MRIWNHLAQNRATRPARTAPLRRGKIVDAADARALLERVLEPGATGSAN
jgi:malonate decarboxylase alpha subunit